MAKSKSCSPPADASPAWSAIAAPASAWSQRFMALCPRTDRSNASSSALPFREGCIALLSCFRGEPLAIAHRQAREDGAQPAALDRVRDRADRLARDVPAVFRRLHRHAPHERFLFRGIRLARRPRDPIARGDGVEAAERGREELDREGRDEGKYRDHGPRPGAPAREAPCEREHDRGEQERPGKEHRHGADSTAGKEKGRRKAPAIASEAIGLCAYPSCDVPYAATRRLYSCVRVSISMRSPVSQNAGTLTSKPVASLAGVSNLPDVSPRTAGSVYFTSRTMVVGISKEIARPS